MFFVASVSVETTKNFESVIEAEVCLLLKAYRYFKGYPKEASIDEGPGALQVIDTGSDRCCRLHWPGDVPTRARNVRLKAD